MKRSFGSLIILPPSSPRVHRLRYTRTAIRAVIAAGLILLCLILTASQVLPPPASDAERSRLEMENQALKTQNKNLEVEAKRLETRVSHLEEMSKRMTDLVGKE